MNRLPSSFALRVLAGICTLLCAWGCRSQESASEAGPGAAANSPVQDILEVASEVVRDESGEVVRLAFALGRVGDSDLMQLSRFRRLNKLVIQECPRVTDASVAYFSHFPELEHLELIRVPITDRALAQLQSLPALESLTLHYTDCDGSGLNSLAELPLHHLRIGGPKLTAEGLAALSDLPQLVSLEIGAPNVSAEQLPSLTRFVKLRRLNLYGTPVTDPGLKIVAGMTALETLEFSADNITDAGMALLGTLTGLTSLNLVDAKISGEGLKQLAGLEHLQLLQLGPTIDDGNFRDLPPLPALEHLMVESTLMTGAAFDHLVHFPRLKLVEIHRNRVTAEGRAAMEAVRRVLPDCRFQLLQG